KTYLAQVNGTVDRETIATLRKGIELDDGPVRPDRVKVVGSTEKRTMVEIVVHEGRNRIVRRTFDAIGHPVRRLARTRIGPVRLGRLPVGEHRVLTRDELGQLLDLVGS